MNLIIQCRDAARFRASRLPVLAMAAGLGLVPLADARAQHADHDAHAEHRTVAPTGRKPGPTKPGVGGSAARQRQPGAGPRRPAAMAGHGMHGPSASDSPAVAEFKSAHESMMRGMAVPYTGDPDADFRLQMIPHHQGAIDMARVALRHAKDPWTRQLAEAVIVEQQREIAEMQAWLAARGIAAPAGGGPRHLLTASSYRHLDDEPGTLDEAVGQSWAPGSGVPARR